MDYLKEILDKYRISRNEHAQPLSYILDMSGYDDDRRQRSKIKKALYLIEQFRKNTAFIYNGYADAEERFELYTQEKNKVIDSINDMDLNIHSIMKLIRDLEGNLQQSWVIEILFNVGNEVAYSLVKSSQGAIQMIEPDPDGDILIYGKKYKKITKTSWLFTAVFSGTS